MNRIVIAIVIVGVILILISYRTEHVEVRPVIIRVVDSVTKEPIEGAVVYYKLQAMKNRNSLGIPLPHEMYRDIAMKRAYTDSSGTVLIPKQVFRLKPYEEPQIEEIYINLDVNPSAQEEEISYFFKRMKMHNPIGYLKGMMIMNHGSTIARDSEWDTIPDDAVFTAQHNWGTFLKEEETVTVELERW